MLGFVVGSVRMVLDFCYTEPECGEPDLRPAIITKVHYMYFATLLFWQTVFIVVAVSLMTEPPSNALLIRTTYWTRYDRTTRDDEISVESQTQPEILNKSNHVNMSSTILEKTEPNNIEYQDGDKNEFDDVETLMITENGKYIMTEEAKENLHNQASTECTLNGNFGIYYMTEDSHSDHLKNEEETLSKRCFKVAFKWFCNNVTDTKRAKETTALHAHLESLSCLKQNRKTKMFLNVNLVIILLIGVSLYVGFSVTGV